MTGPPAPTIPAGDPLAVRVTDAIRGGDVAQLCRLLDDNPELARAQLADPRCDDTRSLLHVATDWPGDFPNGAAVVRTLVTAGSDVDARGGGRIGEAPLHWAASSDDLAALDALLDAGADIDVSGAVIAGGTPLEDAVAFGQWNAARRLVERGATVTFRDAAALGLVDAVREDARAADADEISMAFWYACHGGQPATAALLLDRGADLGWVAPWDGRTPLDAAVRSEAGEVVDWLQARSTNCGRARLMRFAERRVSLRADEGASCAATQPAQPPVCVPADVLVQALQARIGVALVRAGCAPPSPCSAAPLANRQLELVHERQRGVGVAG